MKPSCSSRGFTLIELLVVISIIGLLSSVVLASLNSARAAARDAKRLAEVRSLDTALFGYVIDRGSAPSPGVHISSIAGCRVPTAPQWSSGLAPLVPSYIPSLPIDPTSGWCYMYSSFTNSSATCGGESINNFHYVISFEVERTYPNLLSFNGTSVKCVQGPRR